jgi:alpha-tubulin suppressor-like RCC1 family protein
MYPPLPSVQILQVACGGMHTVVLTTDGQIYTWGVNDEGALGRETGVSLVPLRVSRQTFWAWKWLSASLACCEDW